MEYNSLDGPIVGLLWQPLHLMVFSSESQSPDFWAAAPIRIDNRAKVYKTFSNFNSFVVSFNVLYVKHLLKGGSFPKDFWHIHNTYTFFKTQRFLTYTHVWLIINLSSLVIAQLCIQDPNQCVLYIEAMYTIYLSSYEINAVLFIIKFPLPV